jgi:hypothetical protein
MTNILIFITSKEKILKKRFFHSEEREDSPGSEDNEAANGPAGNRFG